ncbi:MAG: DsbA family oxidoreductase [Steroidobacteraceae bacterium]
MPVQLSIDYISDIACPWCAVGLASLELALQRTAPSITAEIRFQPFELNPDMRPDGENLEALLTSRYGGGTEQFAAMRNTLRARAAAVGLVINQDGSSRIYNTFAAHRLLHWAHASGRQLPLQRALFKANFTEGTNVSDEAVLVAAAAEAGLPAGEAREVLQSGRYAAQVREAEKTWTGRGIRSVPAIIINGKWLISGGQPPEAFEQALREVAAQSAGDLN